LSPKGYSRQDAAPRGKEPIRLVPALVFALSVLFLWPIAGFGPTASAQDSSSGAGATPSGGGTTGTSPQPQGQQPGVIQPQQPYYAPQFPTQYPPAFQGPQTQPFGAPTLIGPGGPVPGSPIPPWTPPVAPPPSQAHPPGTVPYGIQTLGAGKLFDFNLNPNISETWTDNFNQTAQNKQENYRTVLGLGANLLINGATTKGFISSNAGLTYDSSESSQGWQLFPTITAGIIQTLSPRLSLTLTDSFTRSDNPNQANQFGLNTQRQTYTSNTFSAAVSYLIDQVSTQAYYRNSLYYTGGDNGDNTTSNILGLSASSQVGLYNTVTLGYEFSWSDTSGASSGNNSGQSTGNLFTASVARQTGTYSSVGIQGSYARYSPPQENDQHLSNVSLFSTYGFPSGLSLSGSIGYSYLTQGGQPSEHGVTTNSTLSYRFGPAAVSVGLFAGFRPTGLDGGQNFGIQQTQGYTGSFSYIFTPVLFGSIQMTYTENSPTGSSNESSGSNDKTANASANLSWQILRWLSVNANYSYLVLSNSSGSLTGSGTIPVNTATISLGVTF